MKKPAMLILIFLLFLPAVAFGDFQGLAPQNGVLDCTTFPTLSGKSITQLIQAVQEDPSIQQVNLQGVRLSLQDQLRLQESLPQVTFLWQVSVGKALVDGQSTAINFDEQGKNLFQVSDLTKAMKLLPQVREITLYHTRVDFKRMQTLIATYPQVTFHWTIHWNVCPGRTLDLRTDATAFSTRKGRQDPRYTGDMLMEKLQYCPDLLAIDAGHNNVHDLTFLENWPKLRRLIIVDSKKPVTDLTPLAALEDLEYVELFMQNITDISPLAGKTKLLDLNLCHNDITDLSPLYTCTALERLHISYNPHLPQEEVDKLQEVLPNCVIETETYQSTGAGWRDHPRYDPMAKSFEDMVYYPLT